jgi:hypothetical protein
MSVEIPLAAGESHFVPYLGGDNEVFENIPVNQLEAQSESLLWSVDANAQYFCGIVAQRLAAEQDDDSSGDDQSRALRATQAELTYGGIVRDAFKTNITFYLGQTSGTSHENFSEMCKGLVARTGEAQEHGFNLQLDPDLNSGVSRLCRFGAMMINPFGSREHQQPATTHMPLTDREDIGNLWDATYAAIGENNQKRKLPVGTPAHYFHATCQTFSATLASDVAQYKALAAEK